MLIDSHSAEYTAVLVLAQQMCAAARTAPKARGLDYIKACVVTDEDKEYLADEMEALAKPLNYPFFERDAKNVRLSQAVVLIGTSYQTRGLGDGCGYCNRKNCSECMDDHSVCAYDNLDLGIAIGSAAALASDMHIDSRVMFSVGKAALNLHFLGDDVRVIMGIPLCASGKSPFFDRK